MDPRQVGHMSEIELEINCLERQPMLKNPPQVQDREREEKINKKGDFEEEDAGNC